LAGARNTAEETQLRELLRRFTTLPVTLEIADEAALIRRERRLKLPDAIILATARVHGLVLVTRNTRDFPADDPMVRVPYSL
jgi:predicted nucleic acid-binding protein